MRKSHHIRSRTASSFFKAAKFSEGQPRQLNRLVTLNLAHTACPEQAASNAVAALISKFARWLKHQSRKAEALGLSGFGPPTYEAVLEAPKGVHHVHWLVYVPPELEGLFAKTLPKWLQKTAGTVIKPSSAISIKPIKTIMALSRYCMKGVEKHHAKRCYVKPVDQGVIWGKRVMISRSLSAKARTKAGMAATPGKPYAPGSKSPVGLTAVADLPDSPSPFQKASHTGSMPPASPSGLHAPGVQLSGNTLQAPPV